VGNAVAKGANLIFVITNDGWWKDSPGVGQHFSYSRLRAIETRRSVVRSANTGISGFINQKGEVVKKSDVNTSTAIISEIRINNTITFYVLYGDYIGRVSMFLSVLILIYLIIQMKKDR
jgi:apolipoprotein N-acyltransferase